MDCEKVREYYSEYLEGNMGDEHGAIEAHLRECPTCKNELKKLEVVIKLLGNLPEVNAPPGLIVGLNRKIDEVEKGFFKRMREEIVSPGGMSKILAVAATITLVFLGVFYISGRPPQKGMLTTSDATTATRIATRDVIKPAREARPGAVPVRLRRPKPERVVGMPDERRVRSTRSVASRDLVRPVSLRSGGSSARRPADGVYRALDDMGYRTTATQPRPRRVDTAPQPKKSKAAYFDYIVLIKSENKADCAEQVVSLIQTSEGISIDYGDNAIFAQIPIELADNFLQALESLGEVTVIKGPLDRLETQNFLFIVVTLPVVP